MPTDDEKKQSAIVALVKGILAGGDDTAKTLLESIHSFDDLIDGSQYFFALHRASPSYFEDPVEKVDSTVAANWILRKRKLHALTMDMNHFARSVLAAAPDFDVAASVDMSALHAQQLGADWKTKLQDLGELVTAMLVLSGSRDVIEVLNKLSSESQQALSQCVKRLMGVHGFTPAKKGNAPAKSGASTGASSTAGAAAASSSSGAASSSSGKNADVSEDIISYLRSELKEKQAQCQHLESRCEIADRERHELQARLAKLQQDHEGQQSSAQSEKVHQQQLAKKDDTIRELTAAVSELTSKGTQLRDKLAQTEEHLEQTKKRAMDAENTAKQRSTEKQDLMTQMSILQEKAESQQRARRDMSDEVRSLKEENDRLTARLATHAAGELQGVDGNAALDDSTHGVQEEELEELRQELANAQRELALLKRSGFRSNAPSAAAASEDLRGADSTIKTTTVTEEATGASAEHVASLETALSLRDGRIVELERGTGKLEQHLSRCIGELEALREENKRLAELESEKRRGPTAVGDAETLQRDNDRLKKQMDELVARTRDKTEATRKEQAILVSTVARVGHRNLLLQQRQQLTAGSMSGGKANASGGKSSGGMALFGNDFSNVWSGWLQGSPNDDVTEIPGSFLTKHRRTMERGLLDALVTAPISSSSSSRR